MLDLTREALVSRIEDVAIGAIAKHQAKFVKKMTKLGGLAGINQTALEYNQMRSNIIAALHGELKQETTELED